MPQALLPLLSISLLFSSSNSLSAYSFSFSSFPCCFTLYFFLPSPSTLFLLSFSIFPFFASFLLVIPLSLPGQRLSYFSLFFSLLLLFPASSFCVALYERSARAAPLAARKKGGPKRTSYFLCSDSNLGGPKWPPMI